MLLTDPPIPPHHLFKPLSHPSINSFHNRFRFSFSSEGRDECSISSSFSILAYLLTASICHSEALSLKILRPNASQIIPLRYADADNLR